MPIQGQFEYKYILIFKFPWASPTTWQQQSLFWPWEKFISLTHVRWTSDITTSPYPNSPKIKMVGKKPYIYIQPEITVWEQLQSCHSWSFHFIHSCCCFNAMSVVQNLPWQGVMFKAILLSKERGSRHKTEVKWDMTISSIQHTLEVRKVVPILNLVKWKKCNGIYICFY